MSSLTKKRKNLISLISGIILIIGGLSGVSISLSSQAQIAIPAIFLLLGVVLAILGGLRKW